MKNYQPHLVANATRLLLQGMGFDTDDPAIKDTPDRMARAFAELTEGYRTDIEALLGTEFEAKFDQLIMLRNIPFHSLCEHHLMVFHGTATVAYLPNNRGMVVGLSKLARLVEAHARRLQLQERMTKEIADDLEKYLKPDGIAVVIQAKHFCMCARGVNKPGAEMLTNDIRGVLREQIAPRAELMQLWSK